MAFFIDDAPAAPAAKFLDDNRAPATPARFLDVPGRPPTGEEVAQLVHAPGSNFIPTREQAKAMFAVQDAQPMLPGILQGIKAMPGKAWDKVGEMTDELADTVDKDGAAAPLLRAVPTAAEGLAQGTAQMAMLGGKIGRNVKEKISSLFLSPEDLAEQRYKDLLTNVSNDRYFEETASTPSTLPPAFAPMPVTASAVGNVADISTLASFGASAAGKALLKSLAEGVAARTLGEDAAKAVFTNAAKAAAVAGHPAVKGAVLGGGLTAAAGGSPEEVGAGVAGGALAGTGLHRAGGVANLAATAAEKTGSGLKYVGGLPEHVVGKTVEALTTPELAKQAESKAAALGVLAVPLAVTGNPLVATAAGLKAAQGAGATLEKAGQFAQHYLATGDGEQISKMLQIARHPDSPQWMKAVALVLDKTGAEQVGRFAGGVAESALHGAAIGGGLAAAAGGTPEEIGGGVGSGGMLGAGMRTLTEPLQKRARIAASNAKELADFGENQIKLGADPEVLKRLGDETALAAARLENVFGGRVQFRFLTGDQYKQQSRKSKSSGYYDADQRTVFVNLDSEQPQATFLHEAGHALANSEAASTPQIRVALDQALGGPDRLQTVKVQYEERMLRGSKSLEERGGVTDEARQTPEYQAEVEAAVKLHDAASLQKYGDKDQWAYNELYAESVLSALYGRDILKDVLPRPGNDRWSMVPDSFEHSVIDTAGTFLQALGVKFEERPAKPDVIFANFDDVLDSPELRRMTYGYLREMNSYVWGKGSGEEKKAAVTPEMVGKHASVPLHPQANGAQGNDFAEQDAKGNVRIRSPKEIKGIEMARSAEVEQALQNQPVKPLSDTTPDVAPRQTVGGQVRITGTKLGDWFYNLVSFGDEAKAIARKIEQAIDFGKSLRFWYQAVSTSGGERGGWMRNLGKLLGGVAVSQREVIPFGFEVSRTGMVNLDGGGKAKKGGNLFMVALDLSAANKRITDWQARGRLNDLWNGDGAAFRQDLISYLKNNAADKPGETGIGAAKRDVINTFIVGDHKGQRDANALRESLSGKDRQGIIRSFRLDRIESMNPGADRISGKPNYPRMVMNLRPDSTPDEILDNAKQTREGKEGAQEYSSMRLNTERTPTDDTPLEAWLLPNGRIWDASLDGHLWAAKDYLTHKTGKRWDVGMDGTYSQMKDKERAVRVSWATNADTGERAIVAEGSPNTPYDKLPKAQRSFLEAYAERAEQPLLYNDEVVWAPVNKPVQVSAHGEKESLTNEQEQVKYVFSPPRDESSEPQYKSDKQLPYTVGKPLRLIHYSGTEGLTSLSPKQFGKGQATPNDRRGGNKVFAFVEGSPFQADRDLFADKHAYGAVIDGSRIYDLSVGKPDPAGYFKTINREEADDTLKRKGYVGLKVDTADGRQVVMLYKPLKVKELGPGTGGDKAQAPAGAEFSPAARSGVREALKDASPFVKDGQGEPKPFYHGSPYVGKVAQAGKFDPNMVGKDGLYGPGFYFTDNSKIAGGPSRWRGDTAEFGYATPKKGTLGGTAHTSPGVIPVFLNVRQPFDVDARMPISEGSRIWSAATGEKPGAYEKERGAGATQVMGAILRDQTVRYLLVNGGPHASLDYASRRFNIGLQEAGYDGITHIGGGNTGNTPHRVVIAFEPEQVISAYRDKPTGTAEFSPKRETEELKPIPGTKLFLKPEPSNGNIGAVTADGEPAGSVWYKPVGKSTVEIEHLEIDPQYQRQGVGEALLRELAATLPGQVKSLIANATSQGVVKLLRKVFGQERGQADISKLPASSPDDWGTTKNRAALRFDAKPAGTAEFSPDRGWQTLGPGDLRLEQGEDRYEIKPEMGGFAAYARLSGMKPVKLGWGENMDEAKGYVEDHLKETGKGGTGGDTAGALPGATQSHYWLDPSGKLNPAPQGHVPFVSDWYKQTFGKPMPMAGYDQPYNLMESRGWLRMQSDQTLTGKLVAGLDNILHNRKPQRGTLFVEGSAKAFENLPPEQQRTIQALAGDNGMGLMYNHELVGGERLFSPPRESAAKTIELDEPTVKRVAKRVLQAHAESGVGSTYNPALNKNLSGKPFFAVAVYPERTLTVASEEFTPATVSGFVQKNADLLRVSDNSVGTWLDDTTGKISLDVAVTPASRELAEYLGRKYNQKAIYDLGKLGDIATGGTGEPIEHPTPEGSRVSLAQAELDQIKALQREDLFGGFGAAGEDLAGGLAPQDFQKNVRDANQITHASPSDTERAAQLLAAAEVRRRIQLLGDIDERVRVRRAVQEGLPEVEAYFAKAAKDKGFDSGVAWYRKCIERMQETVRRIFPETKKPETMTMFMATLAGLSGGLNPQRNFFVACEAFAQYLGTKRVPDTTQWRVNAAGDEKSLGRNAEQTADKLNALLEHFGNDEKAVANYLLTIQPETLGNTLINPKPSAENPNPKRPKRRTLTNTYGAMDLGPKFGPFFLNMNGHSRFVTVDLWATRTWNRWLGTPFRDVTSKDKKTGRETVTRELPDAPTDEERAAIQDAFTQIADRITEKTGVRVEPMDVQAVLWYFEKDLYAGKGVRVDRSSFDTAAEAYEKAPLHKLDAPQIIGKPKLIRERFMQNLPQDRLK